MGFLDNSGDIILDAFLTDTGRLRLAKGDGSFKIDKFALGDDEIDYALYDKNHASGSAYYDLTILQTPVLEAFTNNMTSMKSRLITVNNNSLLYLPVIKLFVESGGSQLNPNGSFVVPVDEKSIDTGFGGFLGNGILNGYIPSNDGNFIELHQGLDTEEKPKEEAMAPSLVESQYIIQIDGRLGTIFPDASNSIASAAAAGTAGGTSVPSAATAAYTDDDGILNYYFSSGTTSRGYVNNLGAVVASSIRGPRGTKISFRIGASPDLRNSEFLFDQLGSSGTATIENSYDAGEDLDPAANAYKFIDSTVRISGINTGFSVDIPLRFVKVT